jgi:hypothetical protein
MKKIWTFSLLLLVLGVARGHTPPSFMNPIPELNTIKTGLLIGVQKGKYFGVELGMERQWKEIKIKKPLTYAIAATSEYQFEANTIGFKAGPWVKFGRADFTYGINLTVLSDFEFYKFGISPAIGFKFIGFHLLVSYNITNNIGPLVNYNKLHLSLRFFLSKNREFKWKKSDKKKKK